MAEVVLNVPDISCEHCERAVKKALGPLPGVGGVAVDVRAKQVRVTYDDRVAAVDRMKEVLRDADYPVASVAGG